MSDLSEMNSFEIEPFKIDFTQTPNIIQKEILKLPIEEQQYWIDLWTATPEVRDDIINKNKEKKVNNDPVIVTTEYKKVPQDQHWND